MPITVEPHHNSRWPVDEIRRDEGTQSVPQAASRSQRNQPVASAARLAHELVCTAVLTDYSLRIVRAREKENALRACSACQPVRPSLALPKVPCEQVLASDTYALEKHW